eukprot:gene22868-biopygen13333
MLLLDTPPPCLVKVIDHPAWCLRPSPEGHVPSAESKCPQANPQNEQCAYERCRQDSRENPNMGYCDGDRDAVDFWGLSKTDASNGSCAVVSTDVVTSLDFGGLSKTDASHGSAVVGAVVVTSLHFGGLSKTDASTGNYAAVLNSTVRCGRCGRGDNARFGEPLQNRCFKWELRGGRHGRGDIARLGGPLQNRSFKRELRGGRRGRGDIARFWGERGGRHARGDIARVGEPLQNRGFKWELRGGRRGLVTSLDLGGLCKTDASNGSAVVGTGVVHGWTLGASPKVRACEETGLVWIALGSMRGQLASGGWGDSRGPVGWGHADGQPRGLPSDFPPRPAPPCLHIASAHVPLTVRDRQRPVVSSWICCGSGYPGPPADGLAY